MKREDFIDHDLDWEDDDDEDFVPTVEDEVADLKEEVSNLHETVASLEGRLETYESAISDLVAALSDHFGDRDGNSIQLLLSQIQGALNKK